MPPDSVRQLSLTNFRSYAHADMALDGRPVALHGPNGAGKTNLLEALSFLAPGRGLRGVAAPTVGRREAGETGGRAWSVFALIGAADGTVRVGAGIEPGGARRLIRIDGEPAAAGRLADLVRLVWLTPREDRLFLEGGSERRRFLDRLTFAAEPTHAEHATVYEKVMRERLRLLSGGIDEPAWLDALEMQAGDAGAALAAGRARTVEALQAEIESRSDRPFPRAELSLSHPSGPTKSAGDLRDALAGARSRDAAAGRSLTGPQRTDLRVIHTEKNRPAAECSTGEQKALILNLVLAQAARLSRAESAPSPILLLDEVAAHLDHRRRAALYEEIVALGLQAFLTGTDAALFEGLGARAQHVRVEHSTLKILKDD